MKLTRHTGCTTDDAGVELRYMCLSEKELEITDAGKPKWVTVSSYYESLDIRCQADSLAERCSSCPRAVETRFIAGSIISNSIIEKLGWKTSPVAICPICGGAK